MLNDFYSLPLNMIVAEQQNLARPDAVRVAIIASMVSSSTPTSMVMTLLLAQREASTTPSGVAVPDVKFKSKEEATTLLKGAGFTVREPITEQPSDAVVRGFVISQEPAGNTRAPGGSVVALTISSGPT